MTNKSVPPLRGLYVVTDAALTPGPRLVEAVGQALAGGARWVQYRDKAVRDTARRLEEARALRAVCLAHDAGFIVNDDLDLALACGADGVHVGADDAPLAQARDRLGPDAIIGVSCYNRLELAHTAVTAGADYVAFGSFYPSSTKPEAVAADPGLLRAARALERPLCAIGGITADNAPPLVAAGADLIAVVSAAFAAADVRAASQRLAGLFAEGCGATQPPSGKLPASSTRRGSDP